VCDTTHPSMWLVSFIYVARLIHPCRMTHPSTWCASSTSVRRLTVTNMSSVKRRHVCDMTHSFIFVGLFPQKSPMISGSFAERVLSRRRMSRVKGGMCVTWLIHLCDLTHSFMSHDSSIYPPRKIDGWVAKIHRMPYICRSLSAKEPYD